jgi:phage terminase small subunit
MPGALRNLRHEAFAQLVAQAPKRGLSNAECYRQAGYHVAPGPACDVSASRLLSSDKVQARIAELIAPAVRKTGVTVASLLDELEQARSAAHDDRQFSAAVQAIAGKARLAGLDRENGGNGSGSQFDKCTSVEEVISMLVAECGSPAEALADFDELRTLIEAYAGDHAQLVPSAPPHQAPGHELQASLQLFRPKYRPQ